MRVKMLIATADAEYARLISDYISEHYAGIVEVSVCGTAELLRGALSKRKYDVALLESQLTENADMNSIDLPLQLWSEDETACTEPEIGKISKYQRISSIVASILERYAGVSKQRHSPDSKTAGITAVWSPAGGVGKTTVALAYALSNVNDGKEVFYLNLEAFSSAPGYFADNSKSISAVFEMLDNTGGNVKMFVQGICSRENGITYLCSPDNYDDICILSNDNIKELIAACSQLADELVIDLSCSCDSRTRQVLDTADKVLLVTEQTIPADAKLTQFVSQNNVFEDIKEKITLVANKGAEIHKPFAESTIYLPYVHSTNAVDVYRALSGNSFTA